MPYPTVESQPKFPELEERIAALLRAIGWNGIFELQFIRTPDGISIELLQAGEALPPAEPWTSMANTGPW